MRDLPFNSSIVRSDIEKNPSAPAEGEGAREGGREKERVKVVLHLRNTSYIVTLARRRSLV